MHSGCLFPDRGSNFVIWYPRLFLWSCEHNNNIDVLLNLKTCNFGAVEELKKAEGSIAFQEMVN